VLHWVATAAHRPGRRLGSTPPQAAKPAAVPPVSSGPSRHHAGSPRV